MNIYCYLHNRYILKLFYLWIFLLFLFNLKMYIFFLSLWFLLLLLLFLNYFASLEYFWLNFMCRRLKLIKDKCYIVLKSRSFFIKPWCLPWLDNNRIFLWRKYIFIGVFFFACRLINNLKKKSILNRNKA
jgi:hypothetical protein